MNTEYKFDKDAIRERVQELIGILRENTGKTDLVESGVAAVAWRLEQRPLSYRDYGPYWWALKRILIAHNVAAGVEMDTAIANEYRGDTDAETIVMADTFRDLYLGTFFRGTNDFTLDVDSEKPWKLIDPDYENLALMMSL